MLHLVQNQETPDTEEVKMLFYRYDDQNLSSYLPDKPGETIFELVRETPCGYWVIEKGWFRLDKPRWVSKTCRKRHCYPTRAEALVSYAARKDRQVQHLTAQLSRSRHWQRVAQTLLLKDDSSSFAANLPSTK